MLTGNQCFASSSSYRPVAVNSLMFRRFGDLMTPFSKNGEKLMRVEKELKVL